MKRYLAMKNKNGGWEVIRVFDKYVITVVGAHNWNVETMTEKECMAWACRIAAALNLVDQLQDTVGTFADPELKV